MSNIEQMLVALINGETINIYPQSRVEKYLLNCIEECGCENLPEPISRIDVLLYTLAEKISNKILYGTTRTDDQTKIVIPEGKDNFILQIVGEEHQQNFVCTVLKTPINAAVVFDFGNSYCASTPEQVFLQHDKTTGTVSFSNESMFFKENADYTYAAW